MARKKFPQEDEPRFFRLEFALQGWWGKPEAELPAELQSLVKLFNEFSHFPWDELDAEVQQYVAQQFDNEHPEYQPPDPDGEVRNQGAFEDGFNKETQRMLIHARQKLVAIQHDQEAKRRRQVRQNRRIAKLPRPSQEKLSGVELWKYAEEVASWPGVGSDFITKLRRRLETGPNISYSKTQLRTRLRKLNFPFPQKDET